MSKILFQHLAVCLPAYNERHNLETLIPEIDSVLDRVSARRTTVYVFDDGSDDGTSEAVRSLWMENAQLVVIQSTVRVGKSAGLQHCLAQALGADADALIMMDADGQDDPVHFSAILDGIVAGADVVNGRRINRAHSAGKKLSSRAFNSTVRTITGEKLWDINSGFKGFSRRGAETLAPHFYGELHRVILVVASVVGLQVADVPVVNRARTSGRTKYGIARGWRGIFDLLTIQFLRRYHSRPGHFFSGVGTAMVLCAVPAVVYGSFFDSHASADSPFIWAGLAVGGFGLILMSFGFLAELMLFVSKNPITSVVTTVGSVQRGTRVDGER